MTLDWHEEAQDEFSEAAAYYESQDDGLGERFITNVEVAVALAHAAPLMPRHFDSECRKVRVEKFPYAVVYRVREAVSELQVLAVMHLHRRPGYWKGRLSR